MADTAAWLVDHVLPDVGVRQRVVTFPWSLRFQLARDPALCRAVRRTFLRAVFGDYARRAARGGLLDARTGAVNVVQQALADTDEVEYRARRTVDQLALVMQASLLVQAGNHAVADAFIASRLGQAGERNFGTLPRGLDLETILQRANPRQA